MTEKLDLTDIQGNIIKTYGRFSFVKARYLLLRVNDADNGRAFVGAISKKITSAVRWAENKPDCLPKPNVTTNIAFTFKGLQALEVPTASLMSFSKEFIMGMQGRKAILGDDEASDPQHWDKVWHEDIHIWISINGLTEDDVEQRYQWILEQIADCKHGVTLLTGHRGSNGAEDLPFQQGSSVFEHGKPTAKEHFGYRDGIGDPVFIGQEKDPDQVIGRGKLMRDGSWQPLATGEFILGHMDEALEYPAAPTPRLLSRNGTYMVYRKLHENVGTFNRFLEEQSQSFDGSKEMLAAKFAGRWRDNGAPIVDAPDDASKAEWDERYKAADRKTRNKMLSGFDYNNDLDGAKCPLNSHIRRINPRGSLEFGVKDAFDTPCALANRRRIIRRGLPYGEVDDPNRDDGNHGIIFMALNVSIERQFEFIQQQWINYGNDFKESNDKEPLLGNHHSDCSGKMIIPAETGSGKPPHFVKNLPRFVETRGGEYFFLPSITAIKMIAAGIVDPT